MIPPSSRSHGDTDATPALQWPILWSVVGPPIDPDAAQTMPQTPIYFNRTDVKEAIHAPADVSWSECSETVEDVFPNGDASLPPAFTVLPNVIEKSVRSVIVHGLADYILIAEGARIVLQNMTCTSVSHSEEDGSQR